MSYSPHLKRVRSFPDERAARAYYRRNYGTLMSDLPQGRVLDLGCGLGDFLVFCGADLAREAVGADRDAENVAYCREQGLDARQETAAECLARPDLYAAIVMNDVIEHIAKPEIIPLVSLIRERLLPGGKAVLKTPNMANPLTAARTFHMDLTHEVGFTEDTMVYVLEQAGFADIQVLPVDIYVTGSAVANLGGRLLSALQHAHWRLWYKVHGVPRARVLTKGLIGCGVRST